MAESLQQSPEFSGNAEAEHKLELIERARKILNEKAELVIVRSSVFSKPTQKSSGHYPMTALERATRFVPSQSGLAYLALRDRFTEKGVSTIELLSISSREYAEQGADISADVRRPLLTFTKQEILYKSGAAGSMLVAAENYLHALDDGLQPIGVAIPRHLPALIHGSLPVNQDQALDLRDPSTARILTGNHAA